MFFTLYNYIYKLILNKDRYNEQSSRYTEQSSRYTEQSSRYTEQSSRYNDQDPYNIKIPIRCHRQENV